MAVIDYEVLFRFIQDRDGWIFHIGLILLATLAIHGLMQVVLKRLEAGFARTTTLWDDAFILALRTPVLLIIWVAGISFAGDIAQNETGAAIFKAIDSIRDLIVIAVVSWFCIRFIREVERKILSSTSNTRHLDETTAQALSKLLKAVVIMSAILVAMQTRGFSISGLLAFGGVGGLAVGFAAKDMLANFFGGFMIYLDRPFKVGDWVRSPDKNIEGVVEYIGWRQTRIRTFDQRPLYVPNATFSSISVENPSRMRNRRINEVIGIRYRDAHCIIQILDDVRDYLANNPEIAKDRTLMVNFTRFGPSSLDFFIYCFTKTTDWVMFEQIKENVLLRIMAIIHSHGADIAFPTTTLDIPEPLPKSVQDTTSEPAEGDAS
ncbi:mechanosensitive ion channel family protein [Kistimonas asteriae]|uniref:mechanosensitive ion channel family protein n=1 Tax=Kistimonas asteriae TaxID=517724 RepID=UPI001BACC8AA|nr:mechanosensitive ion channel family protein [Kistimonas asteriae]